MLKRYGKSEEVAALVVYLASPEAAYITGQVYNVDGGWTVLRSLAAFSATTHAAAGRHEYAS